MQIPNITHTNVSLNWELQKVKYACKTEHGHYIVRYNI